MAQFMTGKENLTKPSHLKWPVDVFDGINLCGKQLITRETMTAAIALSQPTS
jgi:hypothetical protein